MILNPKGAVARENKQSLNLSVIVGKKYEKIRRIS